VLAGSTPPAAPSVVLERRSWVYDNLGRASSQRTLLRDQATATSPARLYEATTKRQRGMI
jgi:hypothetical protein